MRGAEILIPVRFLTLTSHLCVVISLLWESHRSIRICLPSQHYADHFQIYHSRLVAGFASSLALIIVELATFLSGLTMFSPSVCLLSSVCHGTASIALTYYVLAGWHCGWYWLLFALLSVAPACADLATAMITLCSLKWR